MDIKAKIEELVKKIQSDEQLQAQFREDPVKAVEGLLGVDLPDDTVQSIVTGVKACSRRSEKKSAEQAAEEKAKANSGDATNGFTGCMILHSPILDSYKDENDNYDFTEIYSYIKKYYEKPDIMTCEMEGSIGDETTGYSGHPLFRYPDTFPADLESVGFDLQMLATNHIYDGKGTACATR